MIAHRLSGRTVDAVAAAIEAIPGCRHLSTRMDGISTAGNRHVISFAGWSPSLHAVGIKTHIHIHTPFNDDPVRVLEHLGTVLATQRARAAAGDAIGHHEPLLTHRGPVGTQTEIGHLEIDASFVPLLLRGADGRLAVDPILGIDAQVALLHCNGHGGRSTLSSNGVSVRETTRRRLFESRIAIRAPGSSRASADAILRGSFLRIDGTATPPQTVIDQLAGRPLSALIRLDPAIDSRTIRWVRIKGDAVEVALEPLPFSLRGLQGLSVQAAQDLLLDVVAAKAPRTFA